MLSGLYSGASALQALERQQALVAGNLANLQSSGHRRAVLGLEERFDLQGHNQPGAQVFGEGLDFSTGTLKPTGSSLDVAINGDGFFSVSDGVNSYFTRAGNFHRSPSGQLVNSDGFSVEGSGGPITIGPEIADSEIVIAADGSVSARGQSLGQLALTAFVDNQELLPSGQVYFRAAPGQPTAPATGTVMQGTTELSNAQPVTELVSLIITQRMFEAAQRSIRTISDTVQQNYRDS